MDVSVSEDFLRAVHQGEMSEKQVHILPTGKCKRERPRVCVRAGVCVRRGACVRAYVRVCVRIGGACLCVRRRRMNTCVCLCVRMLAFQCIAKHDAKFERERGCCTSPCHPRCDVFCICHIFKNTDTLMTTLNNIGT